MLQNQETLKAIKRYNTEQAVRITLYCFFYVINT